MNGMGHPEFLEQGKRLTQQILDTSGISLTASCEFKIGSCEKCTSQFGSQSFALGRCLGLGQVHHCCLPFATFDSKQSQDAIDEEPVVLATKGEQAWIEVHGSRLFIKGHFRQRETHQKWCCRQDVIWQGVKKALLLRHSGTCLFTFP